MRNLRLSLVGTVILALLGGIGGAVTAQDEEGQPGGSGPFSVRVEVVDADDWVFEPGPPYGRMYDWQMVIKAEATDPRFSGTWTLVQNVHAFGEPGAPDTFMVSTGTARLENEDGVWVGELENFSSGPHERLSLVVEGEGAYAGLTAIIDLADREWNEFKGVVFDGDLPPLPEPEEPSGADIEYAPLPSIDPSLVPDADGFVFKEVAPGIRRLVTDGAGHFPSATYIREARDMDELAVDEAGRVLVWSTTHGVDNSLGGDSQLWILGVEDVLDPDEGQPRPQGEAMTPNTPDGSRWSIEWEYGGGVLRSTGETAERFLAGYDLSSLAITPDGRVWVAEGHDSGEAGGIYVIESDAEGEPVEARAMAVAGTTPSTTSGSNSVPVSSVTLVGEPFFLRANDEEDIRRCTGIVVDADTVVDGEFLPESQCWDEGAVWWEDANDFWGGDTGAARNHWIELELADVYRLDGVIVQADDNDTYLLSYRDADSGSWSPLWTVPPAYAFGMTTRPVQFDRTLMQILPGVATDAVRFAADSGDGMYSVSEIQLFGEPATD